MKDINGKELKEGDIVLNRHGGLLGSVLDLTAWKKGLTKYSKDEDGKLVLGTWEFTIVGERGDGSKHDKYLSSLPTEEVLIKEHKNLCLLETCTHYA